MEYALNYELETIKPVGALHETDPFASRLYAC